MSKFSEQLTKIRQNRLFALAMALIGSTLTIVFSMVFLAQPNFFDLALVIILSILTASYLREVTGSQKRKGKA